MNYFERCKKRIEEADDIEMVELISELFEGRTYVIDGELAVRGKFCVIAESEVFAVMYNYSEVPLIKSDKRKLYELAENLYKEKTKESISKALEDL